MDRELSKAIVGVSKVKQLIVMINWTDEDLKGDDIHGPLEIVKADLAKLETALRGRLN